LPGYCGSYEVGMFNSMINYPAFNHEESNLIDVVTPVTRSTSTTSPLSNFAASITVSAAVHLVLTITITLTVHLFQY
jgi:hypothetical protein